MLAQLSLSLCLEEKEGYAGKDSDTRIIICPIAAESDVSEFNWQWFAFEEGLPLQIFFRLIHANGPVARAGVSRKLGAFDIHAKSEQEERGVAAV